MYIYIYTSKTICNVYVTSIYFAFFFWNTRSWHGCAQILGASLVAGLKKPNSLHRGTNRHIQNGEWLVNVGEITDALWLFNVAMENGPIIDDFPIKTAI